MRIVFTGGGSGGHLTPFEPIIEVLRTMHAESHTDLPRRIDPKKLEMYFFGIADGSTRDFFRRYDIEVSNIPSGKYRRYFSFLNFTDLLFKLPFGIFLAFVRMFHVMPDVIVSKGGYGSLPIVIAGWFYRIPIFVHESDVVSGVANKIAMRFATTIAIGFPDPSLETSPDAKKTFVTGTPVRQSFSRISLEEARKTLHLTENIPTLLVLGGSQGAQQINEALLSILPSLLADMTVIHVTGDKNYTTVAAVAQDLLRGTAHPERYKPFAYLHDELAAAMIAADVVVSRAGATVLAELARVRKPALLIPHADGGNGHQQRNAAVFEQAAAARVLESTNMGSGLFERNIRELITNTELRNTLGRNIAALDHPRAARDIGGLVFKLASGLVPLKDEV